MTKQQINDYITNYCKTHNITKRKYSLFPLYIHLDGFSHSIGFMSHRPRKNIHENNYTSVGFSAYLNTAEGKVWGYENEHQREIAYTILSSFSHQHNAQEILF